MSRCDVEFKKKVVMACCDALTREGFNRFRKEHVDWPFNENFHCWVGLNTGLYTDCVEISPFVGIHAVKIMQLHMSIVGRSYSRSTTTYARHMGELAPNVPRFSFYKTTDIEHEAGRLARLYATVGLEFAKAIGDYESISSLLKQRVDMLGSYPERYACCLYLMGKSDDARVFVINFLSSHELYFDNFSKLFLRFLDDREAE